MIAVNSLHLGDHNRKQIDNVLCSLEETTAYSPMAILLCRKCTLRLYRVVVAKVSEYIKGAQRGDYRRSRVALAGRPRCLFSMTVHFREKLRGKVIHRMMHLFSAILM